MVDDADLAHLRRCVELAGAALESGDEPFGSVLVGAEGRVRFEDANHVAGGDATRHPEFAIARWAAEHLTPVEALPVNEIAPGVPVEGPAPGLDEEVHELHRRRSGQGSAS